MLWCGRVERRGKENRRQLVETSFASTAAEAAKTTTATILACDGFPSVLFSSHLSHSLDSNDATKHRHVDAILDARSKPHLDLIRNPSATFATTAAPHWYESPKQSILVLQRYPDLILDMIASR